MAIMGRAEAEPHRGAGMLLAAVRAQLVLVELLAAAGVIEDAQAWLDAAAMAQIDAAAAGE